jgi:hypothetical protein
MTDEQVVVFGGDWRQLLEVIDDRGEDNNTILSCSAKKVSWWSCLTQLKLNKNMRIENMIKKYPQRKIEFKVFNKVLRDIGKNRGPLIHNNQIDLDNIQIRKILNCNIIERSGEDSTALLNNLIDTIYEEMNVTPNPRTYFKDRAILAPRNQEVDSINLSTLEKFKPHQEATSLFATNSLDFTDPNNITEIPVEILSKIDMPCKQQNKLNVYTKHNLRNMCQCYIRS